MGRKRDWTAAGAARAGREARAATVSFLRDAPIAREMCLSKLLDALDIALDQARGHRPSAIALLMGGMGLEPPYGGPWDMADAELADEITQLEAAPLFVLSPALLDVVIAAARTLTPEDLALLDPDHDLPTPSGVLALPKPILLRTVAGTLADIRAYTWRHPSRIVVPRHTADPQGCEYLPAIRISTYHDTHGPVKPDSFLNMAADADRRGTPLPPWILDNVKHEILHRTPTDRTLRALAGRSALARTHGREWVETQAAAGGHEDDVVIGEYTPGQEIDDTDDRFGTRLLYAFWRLCAQHISTDTDLPETHSARTLAQQARVNPDIRVLDIRPRDNQPGTTAPTPVQWHHRWVVRMHKVRQWYPTEQKHRILYRGPYIKGPSDRPLLDNDVAYKP
ncbi:hypothetical protein ND486_28315 [Pseudonocardia sp. DR1-2]|uniref:hypothetical protein n=1 Tax=Pseudonocardia sp. DR1-2 TaxID=2951168 RepID=UPI0020432636|nr:hypothetical protein [Pseudonocardia sp. DR1-2]MCM3850103.1 hypothetical protein [Pseudonocardia sp. DR1-2]